MNFIIYVDESGNKYRYESFVGVIDGKGADRFQAMVKIKGKRKWSKLETELAPLADTHEDAEGHMLAFSHSIGAVPLSMKELKEDKDRIFQGEVIEAPNFVKMDRDECLYKTNEYFAARDDIRFLERERDTKIKDLKEDYAKEIKKLKGVMEDLEPINRNGCKKEMVNASWERDPDTEKMFLIKIDDLKLLKFKDMTPEELNPDMFDKQDGPEEESSPPNQDYEVDEVVE